MLAVLRRFVRTASVDVTAFGTPGLPDADLRAPAPALRADAAGGADADALGVREARRGAPERQEATQRSALLL